MFKKPVLLALGLLFFPVDFLNWNHQVWRTKEPARSAVVFPLDPGLPDFLRPYVDGENRLFLIIHRTPFNIEKTSLWAHIWLILQSSFSDSRDDIDLGHVQFAWSCALRGKRMEGASGFTGDQRNLSLSYAKDTWGATAALFDHKDGYFETPRQVHEKSFRAHRAGRLKVYSIKVREKSCERFLENFFDTKVTRRLRTFGLTSSNCTSVAMDLFSSVPEFPKPLLASSKVTLYAPKTCFGWSKKILGSNVELSPFWRERLGRQKPKSVRLFDCLSKLRSEQVQETLEISFHSPNKLEQQIGVLHLDSALEPLFIP